MYTGAYTNMPTPAFVFAIVILCLIVLIYATRVPTDDVLYGFWTGDDDFCEKSECDSMLLWIGPTKSGWVKQTRQCYLIIMSDICNQGLTLTYKPASGLQYKTSAVVKFEEDQIWDENVHLHADVIKGTLEIKDSEGTVLARLNKQHDTTNLAKMLDDASSHVDKNDSDEL
jgi:hypothetical protein